MQSLQTQRGRLFFGKAWKGMPADLDCKLFGFPEPKWEWFDLGINTGSKLTIGDPKDGKPLKKCDNKKVC